MPLKFDLPNLTAVAVIVAIGAIVNLRQLRPRVRPLLVIALLLAICLLEYRPSPRRDVALAMNRLADRLRMPTLSRPPRSMIHSAESDTLG